MMQGKARLLELIKYYDLVNPLIQENIGGVHIDLRLDSIARKYTRDIDLREEPQFEEFNISGKGYALSPNEFILASTIETIKIPLGFYGFIETKGNIARAGISSHNTDGHIDPGFEGTITLEIKNNSNVNITIYPGIKIVQLFIWRVEGEMELYEGKYINQKGPTHFIPDDQQVKVFSEEIFNINKKFS